MKNENRFCLETKEYCKFANRCIYCVYYIPRRMCSKSYVDGKSNDYTYCRSNKQKCFTCEMKQLYNNDKKEEINSYCKEAIQNT